MLLLSVFQAIKKPLFPDQLFLVDAPLVVVVRIPFLLLFDHFLSSSFSNIGWLTKFSNLSFIDVTLRGKFRWPYDGVYEDDDGTLTGQNQSMIVIAPDGLTNASSACTPAPYFGNAIQCPLSDGRFVRFGLIENPYYYYYYQTYFSGGPLVISDQYNHSTTVPWYSQELTHSNGYMMVLRVNRTYRISYNSNGVS